MQAALRKSAKLRSGNAFAESPFVPAERTFTGSVQLVPPKINSLTRQNLGANRITFSARINARDPQPCVMPEDKCS
jgi:hypothetical protein